MEDGARDLALATDFLPGMEEVMSVHDVARDLTDEEIDKRFPPNTGANLKEQNPRLYGAARRLYFEFGLSQREIAVVCRISRQTVAGMVAVESVGLEARRERLARLRRLRRLGAVAEARLEGILADEEACKELGVAQLGTILKLVSELGDKVEKELEAKVVEVEPKMVANAERGGEVGVESAEDGMKYLG